MSLPTGTLTFLFSDIEGSSQLWERHPQIMQAAVIRHNDLLQAAIEHHGGHVVKFRGDGVFAVFAEAQKAALAALAAQEALVAEPWDDDFGQLKVRMGVHTGAAELQDDDYYGPTVNRAARLEAAGHGGQILLSEVTRGIIRDTLPPEAELLDLGKHHVRDFPQPEHLFQLTSPQLPKTFPPLRSLRSRRSNLPAALTHFIGREEELAALDELITSPETRLVTIVGPGGMGKTRLALEAATSQLANSELDVYFVPLAPLSSAADIGSAVAEALGFQFYERDEPQQQLLDYFRRKRMLLVVDNFEHLLDGAKLMGEILRAAPGVKILVTSREKLNLQEETRFRLEGMDFPDWESGTNGGVLSGAFEYSAVKLFLQSARRARPGFELEARDVNAVVHICRLVEGMPLGVLLAAAWVEMFSPEEIAAEIKQSADFLATGMRDVPDRHRSIRAVFETTWNRLSQAEQKIFMRLSVFRGGFRREAAQAIANADLPTLIGLINKSLLRRDPKSGRYEIHELLRQYAGEHLEATGMADEIAAAHGAYYARFMEERLERMLGPGQVKALDEIEADFENVRRAWRWAVVHKDYDSINRATESLFVFSDMRSREHEGEELLGIARIALVPKPGEEPHPAWGRLLLPWYDILLQSRGWPEDDEEIKAQAKTALAFAQRRGDRIGMAYGLILLAHFANPGEAIKMHEQALTLSPRLDDSFWVRIRIGFCHRALGEYQEAIRAFQQSFERGRENGEKEKMGWSLFNLGETEVSIGDHSNAEDRWRQANRLFRQVGTSLGVVWTNIDLSLMALLKGDFEDARSLFEEALDIANDANRPPSSMKQALVLPGYLALVEGNYQEGQRLFEQVLSLPTASAEASLGVVFAACGLGDFGLARRRLQVALGTASPYRTPATADLVLPAAALILAQEGEWERAIELFALTFELPVCPKGLLEKWPLLVDFQGKAEAALSTDVHAAAWARGQALGFEAAVASLHEYFQASSEGVSISPSE